MTIYVVCLGRQHLPEVAFCTAAEVDAWVADYDGGHPVSVFRIVLEGGSVTITITGAKQAPSWEATQELVRQVLKSEGRLTRIARRDGGVCYADRAVYFLTFTPEVGDSTDIILVVA